MLTPIVQLNTVYKILYFASHWIGIVIVLFVFICSVSCSTGIESTKTIKMNKQDVKMMAKSDEQIFAAQIKGSPLEEWPYGKKFMAMSPRSLFLFDPASTYNVKSDDFEGKILSYIGTETAVSPDLKDICVILFSDGLNTLKYSTGKSPLMALKEIDSSKLPLLADLDIIDEWKKKLVGKTFWTKNSLWYDNEGRRKNGLKFVDVSIKDVMPSTGDFPLKIEIVHNNEISYIFMNYTSDKADSRNFATIFSLNDPKLKYPHITDENWLLIQNGKVGEGMTKEECRLALGNPDELRNGHSTSQTMDIWQYSNGTYLFFTDGLLTSFKQ